jgi:hypothetical protein
MRGERIWTVNTTHSAVPTEFHSSQLDLTAGYKVSNKNGGFSGQLFGTGEDDKAVFSVPGDMRIERMMDTKETNNST